MKAKTFENTIWEVKTENDNSMVVQVVKPIAEEESGEKTELAPEIAFTLTDEVSKDWAVTVHTSISKAEARELAKLLIDLAAE